MSYAGVGMIYAPPGSAAYKSYWDAKAHQCVGMANEGECLARVARHVPVTIGGLGQETSGTYSGGQLISTGLLTLAVGYGLGIVVGAHAPRANRRRRS